MGRPASPTPDQAVQRTEELTPLTLSSDGADSEPAQNRRTALGALLGIATGLGTGAVYGLVRPQADRVPFAVLALAAGLGANVGSVAPMAALGVDDPRSWPASSWVSDLVPHLAYGVVTAAVFEGLRR